MATSLNVDHIPKYSAEDMTTMMQETRDLGTTTLTIPKEVTTRDNLEDWLIQNNLGNFASFTPIPQRNSAFRFLLLILENLIPSEGLPYDAKNLSTIMIPPRSHMKGFGINRRYR